MQAICKIGFYLFTKKKKEEAFCNKLRLEMMRLVAALTLLAVACAVDVVRTRPSVIPTLRSVDFAAAVAKRRPSTEDETAGSSLRAGRAGHT